MSSTRGIGKSSEGRVVFFIPVSCVGCGEQYTGWAERFQKIGCTVIEGATPVAGYTGAFAASILVPLSNKTYIDYDRQQGYWIAQWVQTHTSAAEAKRAIEELGVTLRLSNKELVWQARGPTRKIARDNLMKLVTSRLLALAVGSHAHGFVFEQPMPYSFSSS